MNKKLYIFIFLMLLRVVNFANVIASKDLSIKFADNGEISQVKLHDKLIVNKPNVPNSGFIAVFDDGSKYGKKELLKIKSLKKNILTIGNDNININIKVSNNDSYLAFKIDNISGIKSDKLLKMWFRFPNQSQLALFPLDWVTELSGNNEVRWDWVWGYNDKNPQGSFAIIPASADAEHDENLLKLWVYEGLPKPKIKEEWTIDRAKKWLSDWQKEFSDKSTLLIQADTPEQLYELTKYAKEIGMKKVYLHTDSWRGEYWPRNNSFIHLNKTLFPKGEVDFKKYTDYCKSLKLGVAIHIVSCSIGNFDPDYVANGLDKRLASWVKGKLAKDIATNDKTIEIEVPKGTVFPKTIHYDWFGPNSIKFFIDNHVVLIGKELIKVGHFENTNTNRWILKSCQRGIFNSKSTNHKSNTAITGLLRPYQQAYVADPDSTLLDEVVKRYTDFCNKHGITHAECDGAEVYETVPWGTNKFQWKVYENLDHLTSSNTSSGSPLKFQMEYYFRSSEVVKNNHTTGGVAGGEGVPLFLDQAERQATTPYEIYLKPTERVSKSGNSFNLMRPIPMFGVSEVALKTYGLTSNTVNSIQLWREIAKKISTEQKQIMFSNFIKYPSVFDEAKNQLATHTLYRPEQQNGQLTLTPLQVMGGKHSLPWGWGQEFGPLVPWQYFKINEKFEINNPYEDQSPELLLRVMYSYKEVAINNNRAVIPVNKNESIIESYQTGAGHSNSENPLSTSKHIWHAEEIERGEAKVGKTYYRKEFNIANRGLVSAIYVVYQVDDNAEIYFNDQKLFSSGSYDKAYIIDVSNLFREGKNVLAIQSENEGGPGTLAASIVIEQQGSKIIEASNSSWKSNNKHIDGWFRVNYNDGKWGKSKEFAKYGEGIWPRVNPIPAINQINLMPQKEKSITLIKTNSINRKYLNLKEMQKEWNVNVNMNGARAIAVTVDGDNSGAILQICMSGRGARDYIIPIDFKGEKEILIPTGEVSWSDSRWGWRRDTAHMRYDNISKVGVSLGVIPAKTNAKITISNLRIMQEEKVTLTNLTIANNQMSLTIYGTIESEQYLWYKSGDTATIYDKNWNKVKDVKIIKKSFIVPKGKNEFTISSREKLTKPVYLQGLFIAKDKKIIVK